MSIQSIKILMLLPAEMAHALETLPMEDKDLFFVINAIVANHLVTQGARASVAMVVTLLSKNIPVSAPELLTHWGRVIHLRQQTRPSLVQIMACRLIGTKPSSEPMLAYC